MSYYHTCPDCGAHLDPGEPCDCTGTLMGPKSQARGLLKKEAAPSAANTEDGKGAPHSSN